MGVPLGNLFFLKKERERKNEESSAKRNQCKEKDCELYAS
jgi:hypothetical protein